jgi:hypothetical protein
VDIVANKLKIRLGLQRKPTNAQIKKWAQMVRQNIGYGLDSDQAGFVVAKQVFNNSSPNLRQKARKVKPNIARQASQERINSNLSRYKFKVTSSNRRYFEARKILSRSDNNILYSAADTIEALLELIEKK